MLRRRSNRIIVGPWNFDDSRTICTHGADAGTPPGRNEDRARHLLLVRDPCDRSAVIARCRADQAARGGFVTKAMDGITYAEDLERVEAEPAGFVFRVDSLDAKLGCQCLERSQRRRR